MGRNTRRLALAVALAGLPGILGGEPVNEARIDGKAPTLSAPRVRPAAVAGSWYPGSRKDLEHLLDELLAAAPDVTVQGPGPIRAVIAPHAGYRFSGPVAAAAFKPLRGQTFQRVMVLAPAHREPVRGLAVPRTTHFETPLGRIPLDQSALAWLRGHPLVSESDLPHRQEHAIELELPLLQRVLTPGWALVPILVGSLDRAGVAAAAHLLHPLADATTLVVISSDFTHYGLNYNYFPFQNDADTAQRLQDLDQGAVAHLIARDAAGLLDYRHRTGITACGLLPMAILLDMLPPGATPTLARYDTSGRILGDYENSVSYLGMVFTAPDALAAASARLGPEQMGFLLRLARETVQRAVSGRKDSIDLATLAAGRPVPAGLEQPAGAFVTLRKDGQLRGCIGTIGPVTPLLQAVTDNAVNAALRDPRFAPVTAKELDRLTLDVSVLSPMRPITSLDDYDVAHHGIVLSKNGRRAVFLPEVATEQGWDKATTLTHLARKAGLPGDAWQAADARFEVFTSQAIHGQVNPPTPGDKTP
ncbi:MAG: AmmeMemoRadiSam system protein B [Magnetococcales bacterium]|nr:AmmeMemoRadiSam system protein B [Magnetococcales bacterium]